MMAAEWVDWLLRSTLALSVAIVVLLALRPLWRRALGPAGVLWLWLLVPAALLATSVPRPVQVIETAAETAVAAMPSPDPTADQPARPATRGALGHANPGAVAGPWATAADALASLRDRAHATRSSLVPAATMLVSAWAVGALALAAVFAWRQRRFHRHLGPLRPRGDGSFGASTDRIGPALIGALRPRIVVPADFETRFDAQQQALVLAHERVHLRRGDLQVNLLATAMRCVFWFNPLVHVAAVRLRIDQELACDAAVLRRHPSAGRAYATALLNTQLADLGLPVGCQWQSSHPLKWRIAMLKQPLAGPVRLALGATLALAASSAAAVALWQVQPERPAAPVASATVPVRSPAAPRAGLAPPAPARQSAIAMPAVPVAEAVAQPSAAPRPVVAPRPVAAPLAAAEPRPAPAPIAVPSPAPAAAAETPVESAAPVSAPPADATRDIVAAPETTTPATLKPPRVSRVFLADVPRHSRERDREDKPSVVVQVEVDADGRPGEAVVVHSELDRAHQDSALRAVRRWRFEPARQDGVPVPTTVLVPVAFDDTEHERQRFQEDFMRHPRPMGVPLKSPPATPARPMAKPPARA